MVGDQRLLVDRFAIATGGHNSGDDPEVVSEVNFSNGKNVTVRGGRVKSRPRFRKVMDLPSGNFQGAYFYRPGQQLVARIDGKFYILNTEAATTTQVAGISSNKNRPQVWFETVGNLLVMQDGQQFPSVFDGKSAWMVDANTTPVGTAMRFANGRLHVASSGSRRILTVGNIMQGTDATTALQFTESSNLHGGGDFSFSSPIRALVDMPVMDTASGQGSMLVGTETGTFTLRTDITERDTWATTPRFQSILFPGVGIAGPLGFAQVNSDVYFQSADGLRSVRLAAGELQTPGSGGLQQEIPERFQGWRQYAASSVHFNDRFLTLVDPRSINDKTVFDGLVALNFESLNKLGQKSPPVFDGYWDGLTFRELVEAEDRCFAVVSGASGDELWELHRDGDERSSENPTQYIDTRAMNAGDPGGLKALHRLDLWMSEVSTDLNIKVSFRADDAEGFTPWETVAVDRQPNSGYNPGVTRQHVSRLTLATPPEDFNIGYNFQIRVAWTGRARLDLLQAYMRPMTESRYVDNSSTTLGVDTNTYDQTHVHNGSI